MSTMTELRGSSGSTLPMKVPVMTSYVPTEVEPFGPNSAPLKAVTVLLMLSCVTRAAAVGVRACRTTRVAAAITLREPICSNRVLTGILLAPLDLRSCDPVGSDGIMTPSGGIITPSGTLGNDKLRAACTAGSRPSKPSAIGALGFLDTGRRLTVRE